MIGLIKNALTNMKGHKLRVAATALWIVIGVTSVIVVGSIGNGAKKELERTAEKIANTTFTIKFYTEGENLNNFSPMLSPIIKQDVVEIKSLPGVDKVTPTDSWENYAYGEGKFRSKMESFDVYPYDKNDKSEHLKQLNILHGRMLTKADAGKNVMVLNYNTAINLNDNTSEEEDTDSLLRHMVGEGILFNGNMYEIVGVMTPIPEYDENGRFIENPIRNASLLPKEIVDTMESRIPLTSEVGNGIEVEAKKGVNLHELENDVVSILTRNHPGIQGFYAKDSTNMSETSELDTLVENMSLIVLGITAITMIVGGIGVMNIMYVTVVERKREIGIRRAIGASPGKIIFQFLVESSVITIMGCIVGVILASAILAFAGNYIPFSMSPTVVIYIQAILSSVLTGIIFGFIPAYKASKIDPIEAIRG